MNAHTKTPWHSTSSSMGVHHYVESRINGGLIQEVASCGPTSGPEGSEGNAEFIVRACNAHDDLVAALEKARPDLRMWNMDVSYIDAAIAKATGEA